MSSDGEISLDSKFILKKMKPTHFITDLTATDFSLNSALSLS